MPERKEAEDVERIFRDYSAGKSMNRMARELRAEKIPTKQGGKWWASTASEILGNSLFAGESSYAQIQTDGHRSP